MNIKIRKAKLKDLEQIIKIFKQVSNLHYENRPNIFIKKDAETIKEYLKEVIDDENEEIIVASDDNKKVYGVLMYQIKDVKEHENIRDHKKMWINELGVNETYRKKGVGTQLMQEAERLAKELQCDRIELNCWDFNQDAIEFYRKLGMKTQRRIMEKNI